MEDQKNQFEDDLFDGTATDDQLFRRGMFLVGEYDLTGASTLAILAKPAMTPQSPNNERLFFMLGTLGTLIGKDEEVTAVTFASPVVVTVEELP